MLNESNYRLAFGVGTCVASLGLAVWTWKRLHGATSLKWEEVGKVGSLEIYPLKSGSGYSVRAAVVTKYGIVADQVMDRSFMVILEASGNKFVHVTCAMVPRLVTVSPSFQGGVLTLSTPKGSSIQVDVRDTNKLTRATFYMKVEKVTGWDCGDGAADWLTEYLYGDSQAQKPPKARLVYVGNPEDLSRSAKKPPYFNFPQFKKTDRMLYHDQCAIMLATSASLTDLNPRLPQPVTMRQFRPNIVVSDCPAFDEDDWAYVRIGKQAQFRTLKPREACARITVNPESGEKQNEVFDTLKSYRVPALTAELKDQWSAKPLFGLHMAVDVEGGIQAGDTVWAVRRKPLWML